MATVSVRRHVWVDGVVQGVFFRAATAEMAGGLGLAGWVRNLSDGRVEAVFEGTPEAVEAAVSWCRRGPRRAVVERVEVVEEAAEGLRGFRVIA
ncbi:MAG: acylphosphatase [Coriobacteriia bacterium]|nr:acylphosphatase [Coriobacteriia bacterium]